MPIYTQKLQTPLGTMIAGATGSGICLFDFDHRQALPAVMDRISKGIGEPFTRGDHPYLTLLAEQVAEYFEGKRTSFGELPLNPVGSAFQRKVWELLLDIPYGETRTYRQQSVAYGDEKAIRAIASANGANGLNIVIPCHRVIGTNGSLTGYGGGLEQKAWLLRHEQAFSSGKRRGELF